MSYGELFQLLTDCQEKVIYSGMRFILTDKNRYFYMTDRMISPWDGKAWAENESYRNAFN